jgi:membrane-bound ClpP family serine protease
MTNPQLAILLFGIGLALLAGELLLPTHGLLGVAGAGAVLAGIVACYMIDFWLGTGVFLGTVVATPFIGALAVKLYPRTPIGRRIVLQTVAGEPPRTVLIRVGDTGVAVSELRPAGVCEFNLVGRLEAVSEHGMIEPGRSVKVVAVENNRPTVRAV